LAGRYKPEHVAQRGILTTDRYGVQRLFPLLSVSAATLIYDAGHADVTGEDLSFHLAPIKARAKTRAGNAIEVDRYSDIATQAATTRQAAGFATV
jgi:hypothetical protein